MSYDPKCLSNMTLSHKRLQARYYGNYTQKMGKSHSNQAETLKAQYEPFRVYLSSISQEELKSETGSSRVLEALLEQRKAEEKMTELEQIEEAFNEALKKLQNSNGNERSPRKRSNMRSLGSSSFGRLVPNVSAHQLVLWDSMSLSPQRESNFSGINPTSSLSKGLWMTENKRNSSWNPGRAENSEGRLINHVELGESHENGRGRNEGTMRKTQEGLLKIVREAHDSLKLSKETIRERVFELKRSINEIESARSNDSFGRNRHFLKGGRDALTTDESRNDLRIKAMRQLSGILVAVGSMDETQKALEELRQHFLLEDLKQREVPLKLSAVSRNETGEAPRMHSNKRSPFGENHGADNEEITQGLREKIENLEKQKEDFKGKMKKLYEIVVQKEKEINEIKKKQNEYQRKPKEEKAIVVSVILAKELDEVLKKMNDAQTAIEGKIAKAEQNTGKLEKKVMCFYDSVKVAVMHDNSLSSSIQGLLKSDSLSHGIRLDTPSGSVFGKGSWRNEQAEETSKGRKMSFSSKREKAREGFGTKSELMESGKPLGKSEETGEGFGTQSEIIRGRENSRNEEKDKNMPGFEENQKEIERGLNQVSEIVESNSETYSEELHKENTEAKVNELISRHDALKNEQKTKGINERANEKAQEDFGRELEGAKRELEGVKRELEGAKRELEGVKRDLEGAKRELEGVKREREGAKRELEGVKRELEGAKREREEATNKADVLVREKKEMEIYFKNKVSLMQEIEGASRENQGKLERQIMDLVDELQRKKEHLNGMINLVLSENERNKEQEAPEMDQEIQLINEAMQKIKMLQENQPNSFGDTERQVEKRKPREKSSMAPHRPKPSQKPKRNEDAYEFTEAKLANHLRIPLEEASKEETPKREKGIVGESIGCEENEEELPKRHLFHSGELELISGRLASEKKLLEDQLSAKKALDAKWSEIFRETIKVLDEIQQSKEEESPKSSAGKGESSGRSDKRRNTRFPQKLDGSESPQNRGNRGRELEKELQRVSGLLEEAQKKLGDLENEAQEQKERIEEVINEKEKVASELFDAKTVQSRLEERLKEAIESQNESKGEIARMKLRKKELKDEMRKLNKERSEKAHQDDKVEVVLVENKELRERIQDLLKQNEELAVMNSEKIRETQQLATDIEVLNRRVSELIAAKPQNITETKMVEEPLGQRDLSIENPRMEEKSKEISGGEKKESENEAVNSLKMRNGDLSSELESQKSHIRSLEKDLADAHVQLGERVTRFGEMDSQLVWVDTACRQVLLKLLGKDKETKKKVKEMGLSEVISKMNSIAKEHSKGLASSSEATQLKGKDSLKTETSSLELQRQLQERENELKELEKHCSEIESDWQQSEMKMRQLEMKNKQLAVDLESGTKVNEYLKRENMKQVETMKELDEKISQWVCENGKMKEKLKELLLEMTYGLQLVEETKKDHGVIESHEKIEKESSSDAMIEEGKKVLERLLMALDREKIENKRLNEQIKEKTTEMGELKKQNEILEAKATLEKENLSFIVKSWEENNSVHMIGMNNVKRGFVSKLWKRLLRQMEEGPEEARKPLRHNEIVGGEQQVVKVPKGEFDHLKNELRILQEEKAKLQKGGNNQDLPNEGTTGFEEAATRNQKGFWAF